MMASVANIASIMSAFIKSPSVAWVFIEVYAFGTTHDEQSENINCLQLFVGWKTHATKLIIYPQLEYQVYPNLV